MGSVSRIHKKGNPETLWFSQKPTDRTAEDIITHSARGLKCTLLFLACCKNSRGVAN